MTNLKLDVRNATMEELELHHRIALTTLTQLHSYEGYISKEVIEKVTSEYEEMNSEVVAELTRRKDSLKESIKIEDYTLKELKEFAEMIGMDGVYKFKKKHLIKALKAYKPFQRYYLEHLAN